ncbi:MAG: ribosome assembly cofactor RimP [Bacteroides sp.]|nr:ribosome assembly cofactor RimP [Bacteroides sp.]MCM1413064.1 ribosome assembly cofactor RimP [Bacteroides sp.]MCM1471770.1 ribosome assembly cofactor RimP [Bacteroides sp.]
MIDKQLISTIVEDALQGTDAFLVDVKVTPANEVTVEIDSMTGVDIDTCANLTRLIEEKVDRDVEDYELEVGSAGLTSPLKVPRQYEKNIGNEVEVLTRDGKKLTGVLTALTADGSAFTLTIKEKVKEPGKKRPVLVEKPVEINIADTKTVKYLINFK